MPQWDKTFKNTEPGKKFSLFLRAGVTGNQIKYFNTKQSILTLGKKEKHKWSWCSVMVSEGTLIQLEECIEKINICFKGSPQSVLSKCYLMFLICNTRIKIFKFLCLKKLSSPATRQSLLYLVSRNVSRIYDTHSYSQRKPNMVTMTLLTVGKEKKKNERFFTNLLLLIILRLALLHLLIQIYVVNRFLIKTCSQLLSGHRVRV